MLDRIQPVSYTHLDVYKRQPVNDPTYLEANRLKKLLEYFEDGDEKAVPNSSILAEFLGTSIFDVG